jgi:glycosyltransferase involved in cell wall biosynthesis
MASTTISIIIPTHNSLSLKSFSISLVIKSLLWQVREGIEIIVVDDRGTDTTMDKLSKLFPSVKIIRSDNSTNNLGCLRNLGAREAQGELLLFVDDDTVLSANSVLEHVMSLMQNNHFACGAHRLWTSIYWQRYIEPVQSISSVVRTLRDTAVLPCGINRINGFRDLNEYTFIGNFGCIRREAFHRMKGFDENFPGWGLEDTDLMMRLCLADLHYCIMADHGISVLHLTHPVNMVEDFRRNLDRFSALEVERGYRFHVNHFFGIYEADGYAVLSRV